MIRVREARDADAAAISAVYQATYGRDYCYPQFFDEFALKKLAFADDTVMIVAEDTEQARILGVASVLLEKGAYSDLVGEFGRLAVLPEARGRGIGHLLMQGRLDLVQDRLHVGIVEPRVVHPYSTRIAARHGFAVVGYMPRRHLLNEREDTAMMLRFFGEALSLRRNHPRVIPEAYQLGNIAMEHCGLRPDLIADDDSAPYPHNNEFELEELSTEGYTGLLRIERGRLKHRELFGPMRLHYGFFKLQARNSHYLLAKDKGQLVGAIGFTIDEFDRAARVFELISMRDDVIRMLLGEFLRSCREERDLQFVEADVSAYAPRMQRTLLELGFLPICYVPALVFHEVERLDIVKMGRLFSELGEAPKVMIPQVEILADLVRSSFSSQAIQPRIIDAVNSAQLFHALNDEQRRSIAAYCSLERFSASSTLFSAGTESNKLYILLSGDVDIRSADKSENLGSVTAGECLAEVSALALIPHTASARARNAVEAAVLLRSDLDRLIRLRPDIGLLMYRNLALGLGQKLLRSDQALAARRSV